MTNGARHRSKYFEEVQQILTNKNHVCGYLKHFQAKLSTGKFDNLDADRLTNLIGNLSNLELKPLHKYFNDREHAQADYWNTDRFNKLYFKWICQQWRVNQDKDKDKDDDADYSYRKLKDMCRIAENSKSVLEFLLTTDSNWTIPPYQDNNNRKPPRCQSLILNPKFLAEHYPDWKTWLQELKSISLEYFGDFEERISSLRTRKGDVYLNKDNERLRARTMQFILDRVKHSDPLCLNEIYSHTKKYRQQVSTDADKQEARKRLEQVIDASKLPDSLKSKRDYNTDGIFVEDSFLHFVCKYYKLRQRAKDGRIFIHPKYEKHDKRRGYENMGEFDDNHHLLTYCNSKPRQKRYQLLYDIASLLMIPPEQLREHLDVGTNDNEDDAISQWLSGIKGLKTNAVKAAQAQKEHRGELAIKITEGKIKELRTLCDKATALHESVYSSLGVSKECSDTVASVYFLAQVHNIAFKDRSGYANTCAVCSADNAHRMQMLDTSAKAQRLPAIPTRIIDGAVKRIARIISNAIVEREWCRIKKQLTSDNKVCVPIITESNIFEFEPDLHELKGKRFKKDKSTNQNTDVLTDQNARIKKASGKHCPYTGEVLGNDGDRDHIIPRTSSHGIMNDEANLIYASGAGNQKKGNDTYTLKNLSNPYKQQQFKTTDDKKIEAWIVEQIDSNGERFKFGNYRNFINLDSDQQKAFRHALFLSEGNALRAKVIRAISRRNRAFVNGTQRYFAQVIADNFHKRAKAIGKEGSITFDFFGVRAHDRYDENNISSLRTKFENERAEFFEQFKKGDAKQKPYSHLIDAQLAFCIAANDHKNDGSLKLQITEHELMPEDNRDTIFDAIGVDESQMEEHNLERRKPEDGFSAHRSFTRDTMYALNYLPILFKPVGKSFELRIGFTLKNSAALKKDKKGIYKNEEQILQIIKYCNIPEILKSKEFDNLPSFYEELGKYKQFVAKLKNSGYYCVAIDKERLHEYLVKTYNPNNGKPTDKDSFFKFFNEISYRTENKKLKIEGKKKETLEGILENDENFKIKAPDGSVELPAKKEWQALQKGWMKAKNSGEAFDSFLRKYFVNRITAHKHAHQKARKLFSLPVINTKEGNYLLSRKGWDGRRTYQFINDSDSRSCGNKIALPAYDKDCNLVEKMAAWAKKSKHMTEITNKKKHYTGDASTIDSERWWLVANKHNCADLPAGVDEVYYRVDNNTRPKVKLVLASDGNTSNSEETLRHPLCKARYPESVREQIDSSCAGKCIIYEGDGIRNEHKKYLQQAFLEGRYEREKQCQ